MLLFFAMVVLVALAVASWMISRAFDEHDCSSENVSVSPIASTAAGLGSCQSTENQKNSSFFESFEIGGALCDGKEAALTPRSVLDSQFLNLNECLEQNSDTRMPNRQLRSNFEWGIVEPEEMSGFMKRDDEQGELKISPKIEDDVWKSTGSVFTFGSNDLILENLEGLFKDIGASIEKLRGFPATSDTSLQNTSISSRSQNQQPTFRKSTGTSFRKRTGTSKSPATQRVRAKSRAVIHSHVQQSAIRHGDPSINLSKRPLVIKTAKSNPTITAKNPSYVDDRGTRALMMPIVSGAHRVTESASFFKASSLDSVIPMQSHPSFFTDSKGSAFSDKDLKSNLASVGRKVDSPSSHSTFKTPSRDSTWTQASSGNSPALAYLTSSKNTSSGTPYSSISEWSLSSPLSTTSSDTSSSRSAGYNSFDAACNDLYNRQRTENHKFSEILKSSLPLQPKISCHQHCPIKETQSDLLESTGGSTNHVPNATLISKGNQDDQLTDLNKSLQPSRTTRQVKKHLSDSFEWDSAFFTSAGILDPEELSCLINGADQSEKKTLAGHCMITTHLNDHLGCLNNHQDDEMATPNASVRKSLTQESKSSCWASGSPSALRMPSPKFRTRPEKPNLVAD